MRLQLIVLFCSCSALFGQYLPNVQFSDLATTTDGSALYVSSPLSLRGDNEYPNQKIFRMDSSGIFVAAQFPREPSVFVAYAPNFYNAIEPDVSGDGKVFSYVAQRTCIGGSACLYVELYESHITGAGPEIVYTGRTRLSRNGRYALRYGSTGFIMSSDPVPALIDLTTGARTPVPGTIPEGRQVASDGTVLASVHGSLVLWKAGASQPLPLGAPARAVISDNASAVAAELQLSDGQERLVLYDVASSQQTEIVPRSETSYHASLSDDGRWLCYVYGGQPYLYDRLSSSSAALNAAPEGVVEAVISGDGSTIWETTGLGRILRLDVRSGKVQEAVARTPLITSIQGAPVPGSLNWMYGSGLSDNSTTAAPPLPEFLDGQSVLLNCTSARMLSVAPGAILYQIPFEAPAGSNTLGLAVNGSPFDPPPWQIQIQPYDPQATTLDMVNGGCCDYAIANTDFSALINQSNPALPGEVVHGYFTGLGQVSPPLPSGAAAPLNQPSPVLRIPTCVYYQSPGVTASAGILFAGMAPGMVGIYQVDIALPQAVSGLSNDPSHTSVLFSCADAIFSVWMNFSP